MTQFKKLLASLSVRQRITIVSAALLIASGLWWLTHSNRERNFRPLYASLAAEDAGAVMQKLKEEGVEYRVEDGGILKVPAQRVAEMRLRMATAGLPKTGRIGFELFDKTNLGQTEFAEQVNYRRAIEGELERSIMALNEVEHARVHISLPKDSVFLESRQEAKASVMISLRPGARLSPANGAGICHLVASAVDRLNPDAVTVLDTRGNMLVRPRKSPTDPGFDQPEADLEYRQKIERDLVAKVNATLEPLLGVDRFRAGASVECDFTSGEQNEENFDPARLVTSSVQKTEDISGAATDTGVPGTASNLPRPVAMRPGGGATTSRKTENTTYQASKLVRRTRIPQGALKHISISVLVDQNVRWEGKGLKAQRILEPPSAGRLKTIRDVVAAATGISSTRGDLLTVETAPFESTLNLEPPPADAPAPGTKGAPSGGLPPWLEKYIEHMPLALRIGIIAGVLLILLAPAAYLVWRRRGRKTATAVAASAAEIAGQTASGIDHKKIESFEEKMASRAAAKQRLDAEALQSLAGVPAETSKAEVLVKYLKKSVGSNPVAAAHLLRTWLND